jgi:hypothetical protein
VGFASINSERLTAVVLRVPARGAWTAECDFETDPAVSGRVTLALGKLTLLGSVVPAQAGAFGRVRKARIVAGSAGWPRQLAAKAYHNDAGVKAKLVAEDLAREIGEELGGFVPAAERIGVDYARDENLTAAGVLEDVIGGAPWWVDFAGVTHVGERPTAAALLETDFQMAAYDPRERVAVITLTDPSMIGIGSVLTGPTLPEPLRVREYQVQADATSVRVIAWCDAAERTVGRLAGLWHAVTARTNATGLLGLYLYRVVSMAADGRVALQAVHRDVGLPDLDPISQWPGVAGVHAKLTPGVQVLVAFIAGDRGRPVLTHYSGLGGDGFVPVELVLGGEPAAPAARQNDVVEVPLMPAVFNGLITMPGVGPVPATGTIDFLSPALGIITTGSSKVRIAT